MSAHYYDAGSGPHDTEGRADSLGHVEHNCGCRHDGRHWLSQCAAARAAWQLTHDIAQADRAAQRCKGAEQ